MSVAALPPEEDAERRNAADERLNQATRAYDAAAAAFLEVAAKTAGARLP